MMRRRDQAGDAGFDVPRQYADLADRVARHLSAEPFDPAVRARHLHQLRELAALQPPPRPSVRPEHGSIASRWRGFQHRVVGTAAASIAALTLSTSAVAAAAQSALPGEPLYVAKRLVEQAQVAAAFTEEGEVALLMDQAQQRVEEVTKLAELGAEPELVAATIETMHEQLLDASMVAMAADDQQLEARVATTGNMAVEQLAQLSDEPEIDPNVRQAIAATVVAATGEPGTFADSQAEPSGPPAGTFQLDPGSESETATSPNDDSGSQTGETGGDSPSPQGDPAASTPPDAGGPGQPESGSDGLDPGDIASGIIDAGAKPPDPAEPAEPTKPPEPPQPPSPPPPVPAPEPPPQPNPPVTDPLSPLPALGNIPCSNAIQNARPGSNGVPSVETPTAQLPSC